jgi:hypothetical protein
MHRASFRICLVSESADEGTVTGGTGACPVHEYLIDREGLFFSARIIFAAHGFS